MLDRLSLILHRWEALSITGGPTDDDLADLGLTRDQAARMARLPRTVPERMAAMAAIFGLTPADLEADRDDWITAAEHCAHCRHKGACHETLEKGNLATRDDTGFCPNAGHYAELAAPSAP